MRGIKTTLIFIMAAVLVGGSSVYMVGLDFDTNGAARVNVQDQTTPPVSFYFIQATGPPTTIATQVAIGDTDIDVVATISAGTYVGIFCPDAGRFFFAEVLAVVGAGPFTITVDTPSDFAFEVGDNVIPATRDLNVSGTLAIPSIFEVQGPGSGQLEVDITRIIFALTCDSQPDDGLFGNIAALTNGLVIRRKDGTYRNIGNVKSNGDFANLAYDITYSTRSVPAGSYGVRVRYSFAGQDKHGVALRLGVNEALQVMVQDNLTTGTPDILSFRAIAEGHVVEN